MCPAKLNPRTDCSGFYRNRTLKILGKSLAKNRMVHAVDLQLKHNVKQNVTPTQFVTPYMDVYLGPCQTSMMEHFHENSS